ncbi:MAG: endonuclease MutS2 [Bradymonadia bacterium]
MTHVQLPEKTAHDLQWPRVLGHLSERCRGPVAQQMALALTPTGDVAEVDRRQRLTTEARALIDRGMLPPLSHLADVRRPVGIAARGGVLDPEDLYAVGGLLETAWRCRGFFSRQEGEAPALEAIAYQLADLPDLARQLLESFDERGDVVDSASPELAGLRTRVTRLHEHLKEEVHGLLGNDEYTGLLQDDYYTIRDDRYVLPIRAGHKRHVPGIIHGWSSSGQTVYIEPQPVVEANNRLLLAQAEVDREIRRLLTELSEKVGEHAAAIAETVDHLAVLDLFMAQGELSQVLSGAQPQFTDAPRLVLPEARHPLLVLSGIEVVPNRIELDDGRMGLVITGPNTGGKTVTLKTAGLCILMALSGLHIPATDKAVVPRVPGVYSDIGDEQSIDRALSTFSGHITNIVEILSQIAPGSLVLLDELVVGTDPIQGAALAQSILEHLASRKMLTLVTTHYESLKALPFSDERFRNGAVGFDPDRQVPTYTLRMDVPGASSAFRTARRLGVNSGIVDRAAELAGGAQNSLDALIQRLDAETAAAETARRELEKERNRLASAKARVEQTERALKARLKEAVSKEEDAALREARTLREEIVALKKRLKGARKDASALEAGRKQLAEVSDKIHAAKAARARAEAGDPITQDRIKPGSRVFVISLGAEAEVLSTPDDQGKVEVRAGALTARFPIDDLRPPGLKGRAEAKGRTGGSKPAQKARRGDNRQSKAPSPTGAGRHDDITWDSAPPQVPDNTVDIRGMRVEEGVERAERFLDTLVERGVPIAFIIHGHGTGALKREIRNYLRHSRYARSQRPGQRHEGGDGVTAVLLA